MVPVFIAPMLAQPLPDGESLDRYDLRWLMEEKIDGQRVIVCVGNNEVRTWSRPQQGNAPHSKNVPTHISAELLKLPRGVYDGEICVAGGKSWDAGRKDRREDAAIVMFDLLELYGHSTVLLPYDERRGLLSQALLHVDHEWAVSLSATMPVSQGAVDVIWGRGGEGVIVKRRAAQYRPGKRSWDWLKVKQVQVAVVEVIGFKPGKTGPHASTLCRDDAGVEFSVSSRPERVRGPITAIVGRRLQIEYQLKTPSGSYRHPQWDRLL